MSADDWRPHTRHPSAPHRHDVVVVLTADGPEPMRIRDPKIRSMVATHANAVHSYLETGGERGLRQFRSFYLGTPDGRQIELLTDPVAIDRLAEGGQLHYELYLR